MRSSWGSSLTTTSSTPLARTRTRPLLASARRLHRAPRQQDRVLRKPPARARAPRLLAQPLFCHLAGRSFLRRTDNSGVTNTSSTPSPRARHRIAIRWRPFWRTLAAGVAATAVLSLSGAALATRLTVNFTTSMPRGLYWLDPGRTSSVAQSSAFPPPRTFARSWRFAATSLPTSDSSSASSLCPATPSVSTTVATPWTTISAPSSPTTTSSAASSPPTHSARRFLPKPFFL